MGVGGLCSAPPAFQNGLGNSRLSASSHAMEAGSIMRNNVMSRGKGRHWGPGVWVLVQTLPWTFFCSSCMGLDLLICKMEGIWIE